MSNVRALRKIGFGLGVNDDIPDDLSAWIDAQLNGEFEQVGYASIDQMGRQITPWPNEFVFDLADRVERCKGYYAAKRQIDESGVKGAEEIEARVQANRDYKVAEWDVVKFTHQPIYGQDPVKQRFKHFWLNHFTVGFAEISSRELTGHYIDAAIYDRLGGSFADMLYGVTSHPAMLTYLDNIYNIGERSRRNRQCNCAGLNDNLARELMELHTVSPARGYTEDDIRGAAKVLAGWGAFYGDDMPERVDDFWHSYIPSRAEPGEKVVLGQTFPPGDGALRQMTDMLAADPWTPRYLSSKLALHFIGESATQDDRDAIEAAWLASNGDLPTVHRAVVDRAIASDGKKFVWPLTWLFQLLRTSGAVLFAGFDEAWSTYFDDATRRPMHVIDELGMNFWGIHQPDGFSDHRSDWISTEHLERRIRFAEMIYRQCNPTRSVDEMIDLLGVSERTKSAIAGTNDLAERFIILACSPEFLEV